MVENSDVILFYFKIFNVFVQLIIHEENAPPRSFRAKIAKDTGRKPAVIAADYK